MNQTKNRLPSPLRLDIGDLETYIISDGLVRLPSIQPIFAPGVATATITTAMEELKLSTITFEAGIQVMLIKQQDNLILLDAGAGSQFGDDAGKLTQGLEALGITPDAITAIVISHAHIDHIGGLLDKNDGLVFPNAQYYIAEREYRFWTSAAPDFSRSKGVANKDGSIRFAQHVFGKIKDKIQFFTYGDTLFSCLRSDLAAGHTPGHTIFTIFSTDKSIVHLIDSFHSPLLVSHPQWGTQWDVDFEKAIANRLALSEKMAHEKKLFMSCHLPWPGLGYIEQVDEIFYWRSHPYFDPARISL